MAVSVKIKNLAPGAYFNAGPVEVVVLEHFTDGRTLLAAKEPIGNRPFTVRPFTYNRMEPEPAANNFAFSTLRFDLNKDFLSALDDAGLPGPIHADEEDRVVRCDCYEPIPEEGEPS